LKKLYRDDQGRFVRKPIIRKSRPKSGNRRRSVGGGKAKSPKGRSKGPIRVVAKPVLGKPAKPAKAKPVKGKPARPLKGKAKEPTRVAKPVRGRPVALALPTKGKAKKPTRTVARPAVGKPRKLAVVKPSKAKPVRGKPVKPTKVKPAAGKPTKTKLVKGRPSKVRPAAGRPVRPSKGKVKKPAIEAARSPRDKPVPRRRKPPKRRLPERGLGGRFVRKSTPKLPTIGMRSQLAEAEIQAKLLSLQGSIGRLEGGIRMAVATYINPDSTVDGELRLTNLPTEWRESGGAKALAVTLSAAFREWRAFDKVPVMGGSFWVSFTIRFGAETEEEIEELVQRYKRHRGYFQITTYPLQAWLPGAIQMALVSDVGGVKGMAESLMSKRGYPPAALLVRVIWMTDDKRPGHFKGE
jgi:hypothetical protein